MQSVHVWLLSGVSKVSPHFTLARSVETLQYRLNLRLTNSVRVSLCILFGVLFEVVNMYSTASANDFADLSFIGTTHTYFERTSLHVGRNV